jgi:hypothetical protein
MVILITVSLVNPAKAQSTSADPVLRAFDQYRKNNLQEKIYVHTDRSSYLSGETLWYKVYLTDGAWHHLLDISKVVYLELLDSEHKPVLQTKLTLKDGMGHGSWYIPTTVNTGNYTLRAYTNWMKNFSPDFFFSKTLTLVNTYRKLETVNQPPAPKPDLQFFPEGGNLVTGLESKVAFRATDAYGTGLSFRGVIINQNQDTIARFEPHKFGIGNLRFMPQLNQSYRAIITTEEGQTSTHDFPSALDEGYVLEVTDNDDQIMIKVQSTVLNNRPQSIHLFIHARNSVSTSITQPLTNGSCSVTIDRKKLAEGINHITVFDEQQRPVCERLYFKHPADILNLSLQKTDDGAYLLRRKVNLNIKSQAQAQGKPSPSTNLSVSVFRNDSLPRHEGNFKTSHWLTSDLKGTIENPEYYFSSSSNEVLRATDNLMLTHGWRRFTWKEVFEPLKEKPFIPEYRGLIISGTIRNRENQPVPNIMTYLSSPSKTVRLYTSLSNYRGEVLYEVQKMYGTSRIMIQTNRMKDSTYRIELTSPWSAHRPPNRIKPYQPDPNLKQTLLNRSVSMQVQDIFYEEELEVSSRIARDSSTFYGLADERYQLDDYTRFPFVEEVMREYVKGVWVRKRKDGFHFMNLDKINERVFDDEPLMMIDGIPFFDADEIMEFDPLKINYVDVITRRYYLGPASFPGIVSFRTYTGDLAGFPVNPAVITLDYEGLQQQREFYSPRYDNITQRRSRLPDQRTLLYWNPTATTDSSGNLTLEFFTSDIPGTYEVVVEGISNDGHIGSAKMVFEVRNERN